MIPQPRDSVLGSNLSNPLQKDMIYTAGHMVLLPAGCVSALTLLGPNLLVNLRFVKLYGS